MENTEKQITSDALDDGGKLGPSHGFGPSGLFLTPDRLYPPRGLVLTPLEFADKVISGDVDMIVRPQQFEIANSDFLLLKGGKALGVVHVGELGQVKKARFQTLEGRHGISRAMLEDWTTAQPSWAMETLNSWPISVTEKFGTPIDTDAKPGPGAVVDNVRVTGAVNKIRDVESYEPSEANDAQLRDDFRILLAWYAIREKKPDTFPYSLQTIEKLLREVVLELVRRGPEVIRFNPSGMSDGVRGFFERVASDARVPRKMFKTVDLDANTEPGDLTDSELREAHWALHHMFDNESESQEAVPDWSVEDIVNLHSRVVDELFARKLGHPPPPDNGLDELSSDFEGNASEQPKWYEIQAKAQKDKYATVRHSGDKIGPKIAIGDVLQHFRTFKVRKPYVYLVGGLANHGETEGDIDILVNDTEEIPEWMRDAIEFRLCRALPPELSSRVQIHYDRTRGPFTNFVELYDMNLERVNSVNEIKEMRDTISVDEKLESMNNVVRNVEELAAFLRGKKASA